MEVNLVTGKIIYPHRPDLFHKKFWLCKPCDAYVGCHGESQRPLGRLANSELRRAKMMAHAAFDPLWKKSGNRKDAYYWLSNQLGIEMKNCHIGEFDVEMCLRVIEVCKNKRLLK